MKCKTCNIKTNIVCHRCGEGICGEHGYHMRRFFYCSDCFLIERKRGLIKAWGALAFIVISALVILSFVK
ncbi:MAG: hypothetical protein ACTSRK_03205 [Promethearchaeota archaeon]